MSTTGPTKLALWRERCKPYVDELCEMFVFCGDAFTQADHDREMKVVFMKICVLHEVKWADRGYIRAIFSDAVAREMGWTRGRLDECAERTLQRALEAAGQMRIPGA